MSETTISVDDRRALQALEVRLRAILPEEYQDSYEDLQPVPMRSAGLKYDSSGKVAWSEIWATFCDLAMAGGPPHRGTLLEPGTGPEIEADPGAYRDVAEEICRGIGLVTDLPARPSPAPGWVRVTCPNVAMAGWLLRAIVMENVSAHAGGHMLDLPAGPGYRLEKEIKNVITSIAKTNHYWTGHLWRAQQRFIADLFGKMNHESPLIEPDQSGAMAGDTDRAAAVMADAVHQATGLTRTPHRYPGWLGLECPNVRAAVWMMRMLAASNALARREGTALFVAVNPPTDPGGESVVRTLRRVHHFARLKQVL